MKLSTLGREVSSSLEQARTSRDAASRVRAKLVARQKPRLRLLESKKLGAVSSSSERILSDRAVRAIAGGLAFAATIAIAAAFAWPHREQQPQRAEKDPVLSFVIGPPTSPNKQEGTVGAFIAASNTEMPVTFSDGSHLRLEPAARVRVAEVANNGARVHVENGTVHVSVVHRDSSSASHFAGTKWAVEAGPFEVRVTGTKFDVAWDPTTTGLVVKLEEGSVFVRGCGLGDEGRKVTAGEELRVTCDAPSKTPDNSKVVVVDTTSNRNEKTVTPVVVPDAPPVQAPPAQKAADTNKPADTARVVALARGGAHAEALTAAEANGFSATCDSLQGPDLLVLADAARYAGRFDRATEALETTRRRFASSDAAATAAFELGRIEMDVRRDLNGAGDHFETYLRERPNGGLAREALGRAIEARQRAGDAPRAERLAVRYLAAYPDGPHAKLARKLTSPEPAP